MQFKLYDRRECDGEDVGTASLTAAASRCAVRRIWPVDYWLASEAKLAWLDTVWLWVVLWECPNNNGDYKMVSVCVSVDTIILKVGDEFRLYIRGQQTDSCS